MDAHNAPVHPSVAGAEPDAAAVDVTGSPASHLEPANEQQLYEAIELLLDLPGDEVAGVLQQRLAAAQAGGRRLEQVFLWLMQVRHRGVDGQPEEAFRLCRQACEEADALDSALARAVGLSTLGGLQALTGDFDAALKSLGTALSMARELGWSRLQGSALSNLSMVQLGTGSMEQAAATLEEAAQLLGDGNRRTQRSVRGNLALTLAKWARQLKEQGVEPALWRAHAERAVALMRRQTAHLSHPAQAQERVMRYAFGCLAAALVVLDELPEACALLQQLRPFYAAAQDARAVLFVDTELTRAALQGAQPQQAVERARRGIADAERAAFRGEVDEIHRLLADALEAQGDYRGALQAHRQFHRLHKQAVLDKALYRTRALAVALETERARRESRLDPLTGLANRRGFDEALDHALREASADRPLTLALLDLDNLKRVNDRHGHADGDQALQLLAALLQHHLRSGDLAARLGGDEFVLLVLGGVAAAAALCTRLQEALREASQRRWPDRPPLTLSVGIAASQGTQLPQELLARADRALYAAKADGRDALVVV